jgi:hypothetical protein
MGTPYLPEILQVQNILRLNVRVLQILGLLLDESVTVSRHFRLLRKGILFLIIFIHIHFVFGSLMELFLSDEDSHLKFESVTLILSYVKGAMQLYVVIISGNKFLYLIKSAEVNFFMHEKPVANTEITVVESYVQTARRLTGFIWITFALTLSSVYIELIPTFIAAIENDATEFDGQVLGRRKTAYKVWTPFHKLESPYLKLDIIYELISVSTFFIVFTANNLLTLMLIIFFTGHFNLLAESIEDLTKKMDHHTSTGITNYSMKHNVILNYCRSLGGL